MRSSGSSPTCCIGGASLSPQRFLCSWMREATVHEETHGGMNRCVKKAACNQAACRRGRGPSASGFVAGVASLRFRDVLPRPASGLFGRQRCAENAAHA